jgi:hypothetical protein
VAKQWIAIDFDHTIRDTGGTNELLPGAREALGAIREAGHNILIHSANSKAHIEQWMHERGLRFDGIWDKQGKPPASCFIDDRAVAFRGDWAASIAEALDLIQNRPVGS